MGCLFYAIGCLLWVIISLAFKYSGFMLGGIPTFILFGFCVSFVPWLLKKIREQSIISRKISRLASQLNIDEEIPAHCAEKENNKYLRDYLDVCVKIKQLTEEQANILFEEYKMEE